MKTMLRVSALVKITLPLALRKHMCIQKGGAVSVEEQGGRLIIAPTVVMGMEIYSDKQIYHWVREDGLKPWDNVKLSRKTPRRGKREGLF